MSMPVNNPLVSIVCEVYNHERFLRKCLDGFVMQKTDFPFEILIHDDASTDGSASIIREYEDRYPGLFFPIYQSENQYSQGINIWTAHQFPRARGKYIALCEGDDYWSDPLKLQTQVDYMESHPDCSLCFHNAIIHWADGEHPDRLFGNLEERDYSGDELCRHWLTPTASFLFRSFLTNDYAQLIKNHRFLVFGDRPLSLCCAHKGKIHALKKPMSVYSKHAQAYTATFDAAKIYNQACAWRDLRNDFDKKYSESLKKNMMNSYILALIRALAEKNYKIATKAFYRCILRHPATAVKYLYLIYQERNKKIYR